MSVKLITGRQLKLTEDLFNIWLVNWFGWVWSV